MSAHPALGGTLCRTQLPARRSARSCSTGTAPWPTRAPAFSTACVTRSDNTASPTDPTTNCATSSARRSMTVSSTSSASRPSWRTNSPTPTVSTTVTKASSSAMSMTVWAIYCASFTTPASKRRWFLPNRKSSSTGWSSTSVLRNTWTRWSVPPWTTTIPTRPCS